jgi:hypothetical protein
MNISQRKTVNGARAHTHILGSSFAYLSYAWPPAPFSPVACQVPFFRGTA